MKHQSRPESLRAAAPGLRRVLHHLRPLLAAERGLLAGGVGALLAGAAFKLLEPWPLKLIIDRVAGVSDDSALLSGASPEYFALAAALGLAVVVALKGAANYLAAVAFALAGARVLTRVREALFRHLQRLPVAFHDTARTGDLTMRLIGDVGMLKEATITAFMPLVANALVLVGMAGVMLWLDWRLALIAFAGLPLLGLTTLRFGRRIHEIGRTQRRRESAMAATAAETLGAIRTIQALGLEDRTGSAFAGRATRDLKAGVRAKRLSAGLEWAVDALTALALAAVIWWGALSVLRGGLTPGDLLVFVTYLKNAFRPVRDYAKHVGRIAKATAAGERVVDLLEIEPAIRDRPDARPAGDLAAALTFEGVVLERGGARALAGVHLKLRAGENLALVGSSGAGKSTLAAMSYRLWDPTGGRVLLGGVDLRDVTLDSLRARIAVAPQDTVLLAGTIAENIALGAPGREPDDPSIERAARLAGAHDFIEALPDGYETEVGERGAALSEGQRRRIGLARAALRDAPILVLDEPTAGLDPRNATLITRAIACLSAGRTTLVVTHDPALAAQCDRAALIERGQVVAEGPHGWLLARKARYAALWRHEGRRADVA
jgi:ATP-binding cassette subfamily B protein